MKKSKVIVTSSISLVVLVVTILFFWIVLSDRENHTIITSKHTVEFTIIPDSFGWLDASDDFAFSIHPNNQPNSTLILEVKYCLSRCWILANARNNNDLLLCGCEQNKGKSYRFDFQEMKVHHLDWDSIPEHFSRIDILSNLHTPVIY